METNHFFPVAFSNQEYTNCSTASAGRRIAGGLVDAFFAFSLAYLIPVLGPILSIGYYLNKDALPFLDGQSLGKKLFQTRVITVESCRPTTKAYASSILRSVTILIPFFNLVELAMLLCNKERFGDKWANTFVIKI